MYKKISTKLREDEIAQLTAIGKMAGFRTNYEMFQAIVRGFLTLCRNSEKSEVPVIRIPESISREIQDIFLECQGDADDDAAIYDDDLSYGYIPGKTYHCKRRENDD